MNRLADETSPYLRQHADQPVDWYPWGDEAFRVARERDVPVLLSVGYSACHWCHVMAHESFDDAEVAAAMNASFVNVKVDREERPDVDALYMDAVQALTGRGGWPMTVALDHEARPFWGGTYFPRDAMLKVVEAVTDAWRTKRDDLAKQATSLVEAVAKRTNSDPKDDVPGLDEINAVLRRVAGAFDAEWGGFGKEPKFPSTFHVEAALRAHMTTRNEDAKRVVTTTLDAMAAGGMRDHIGGGFHRYATDRRWLIPHFEKMLYDQAAVVRVYRQAFSTFGDPAYLHVVDDTITYVLRDLALPGGGFASAEDADSLAPDGTTAEGAFTTWTPDEVRDALAGVDPAVVDRVLDWYDITDDGNFEGRSIPNRVEHRDALVPPPEIVEARRRLLDARSTRTRPALDDKVLTEWNALFLAALADAAATFGRDDWKAAAVANGEFLLRELRDDRGRWLRSWQAGGRPPARHAALAADHAALLEAFLRLHELTGEARWVEAARRTADTMLDRFWDPVNGGLYTTADDAEELVVRQKDLLDNATPSANSSAAIGLMKLAAILGEPRYTNHADRILQLLATVMETAPGAVSNALLAVELRHRGLIEIVIPGTATDLVKVAQRVWRPDVVLAWGEGFDSPLWDARDDGYAYVCRDRVCERPVSDPVELFEQITGRPLPEGARLNV